MSYDLLEISFLNKEMFYLYLLLVPAMALLFFSKSPLFSSILRLLCLCLLITALLEPVHKEKSEKKEVSILFDVSKSITKEGKEEFLKLIEIASGETDTQYLLYPFGKTLAPSIRAKNREELRKKIFEFNNEDLSLLTNFEETFLSLSSSQVESAFLLASDGIETAGSYKKVLAGLGSKKLSFYPLIPEDSAFSKNELKISFLNAPLVIKAKSKVPISLSIENEFNEATETELKLSLDEKEIFREKITVKGNSEEAITVNTEELEGGLHKVIAELIENGESKSKRHIYLSVQEPKKILLISGKREDNRQLREGLDTLGYIYQEYQGRELKDLPRDLDKYRSIIFNNAKKDQLREGFLDDLKNYVREGGGLLLLAGDQSFGLGDYINSALEEISPVSFVEPQKKRKPLKKAIMLLIDKSKSMSKGDRLLAAKKAAFFSIKAVKDDDYIGVIGFDSAPFEVIELDTARNVKKIAEDRLTNRLTALGGTSLLDSLSLAKRRLRAVNTGVKHIIVLGDGEFQDSSSSLYFEEVEAARRAGITISTIALGGEADVPFMRRIAQAGGGSFYESVSAARLPEIFLEDIKVSSGELTLKEQTDFPVSISSSGLKSTSIRIYPDLRGFVESEIKDKAYLELQLESQNRYFPLLASWKYGEGQVISFSSDLNGRWSKRWITWSNYQNFLSDLFNKLKSASEKAEKEISYDFRHKLEGESLKLELSIFDGLNEGEIEAKITKPNRENLSLSFKPVAAGRFQAVLAEATAGDYFIQIKQGKITLPEIGLHLPAEEFEEVPGKGLNISMLSELAKLSSGIINPTSQQFSGIKSFNIKTRPLFMPLLIAAFFLIILEAFVREGALGNLAKRSTN